MTHPTDQTNAKRGRCRTGPRANTRPNAPRPPRPPHRRNQRSGANHTTAASLLTPEEAAAYLRLPVRQLAQWRYLRLGPPYTKAGRAVRYWRADLDAWLAAQRVEHGGTDT